MAKIYGLLMAITGLILGLFITVVNLTVPPISGLPAYSLFGVGAIILLPIFYGVLGFVMGSFTAWLFNLIARFTGGLELEFDKK